MKACSVCGAQKAAAEYHKDSGAKDGHTSRCKACVRGASRLWREQNADHRKAQKKAHYEANMAVILDAQKAYYQANATKLNMTAAAWARANADKVKTYKRQWSEAHAAELKARHRQEYDANAAEWKARNRAWREAHQEQVAAYRRRLVDDVAPSYAASMLGMPAAKVTPELLQMKRDEIALRRLSRLLKEISNEDQQDG